MHAESRTGINFANAAAGIPVGFGDIPGQEIDATDVETNRLDGAFRHLAVIRVDSIGDIYCRAAGREICCRPEKNHLAFFRHRGSIVTQFFQKAFSLVVELEPCQDLFVAYTTSRVFINLIDQLFDRVFCVANDVTRHPLRSSNKLAIYDQEPVIVTFEKTLNDNVPAMFARFVKSDFNFFRRLEVYRNTASVVPGQRFQYHREANSFCSPFSVNGSTHQSLHWYRQAKVTQYAVGLFLVRCEFDGDIAGATRCCRLNTLLITAVTKLHQALLVQPNPWNTAVLRRMYQGGSTRAKCSPLRVAYK